MRKIIRSEISGDKPKRRYNKKNAKYMPNLKETIRFRVHDEIVKQIPNVEFLTIDDIQNLGILGKAPGMNLCVLRKTNRGPKFIQKSPRRFVYPRKEFIEWIYTTKIKICA